MQITSLKSTKRGNRVNIYIDGKFVCAVSLKLVSDLGLYKGKIVERRDIEQIRLENLKQRNMEKVLNRIARRPRSSKEVQDFLGRTLYKQKKKASTISFIIRKLEDLNLINDLDFTRWWVENRLNYKPRGKYLLTQELRRKGISREIISGVLDEVGLTKETELKHATQLAQKKVRVTSHLDKKKVEKKIISFLLRKGFSYDLSRKVIKRLFYDNGEQINKLP